MYSEIDKKTFGYILQEKEKQIHSFIPIKIYINTNYKLELESHFYEDIKLIVQHC